MSIQILFSTPHEGISLFEDGPAKRILGQYVITTWKKWCAPQTAEPRRRAGVQTVFGGRERDQDIGIEQVDVTLRHRGPRRHPW